MLRPSNIIIIENEALISRSIEEALKTKTNFNFSIQKTENYEAADEIIKKMKQLDFVFLNIDIFSKDIEPYTAIHDLVAIIRKKSENVKLLMLTSYSDNYLLLDIIKVLNPDSVLIKSDINFNDLISAINTIMEDTPFYSKTVLRLLRSQFTLPVYIDKIDRLILHYLSKGTKTKDLTDFVFLSVGGIERRKRNLRSVFNVENDLSLIDQARKKRII